MPRLIETEFPYARLSAIAEAESWRKEVHRPVYYIHKWWARRLGSVFRGILLGSCLDEGEDFWKCFYGKNDFAETVIFDPFMGSGVTIGEAIKLGCTTLGQDINPVAYLTCRAAFTKYDPSAVVATYQLLEHTVAPKLLNYFETRTEEGNRATVLYYFLVKVVPCPRCDEQIDLFKSRIFSKNAVPRKDSSARALCPSCGAVNATLYNADYVKCSDCGTTYNPQQGNIKGAKVECDKCGHTFRLVDRMKSMRGPLGYRRYAKMILTTDGQKRYASMNAFDDALLENIAQEFTSIRSSFPQIEITSGYNTNQILKHNYRFWHELFSDRQPKVGGINRPLAIPVSNEFALNGNDAVYLNQGDSSRTSIPDRSVDIVVTDPPFFDNVHYSQLADFFFYWLNQLLDYSKAATTRRKDEVQDTSSVLFANKLTSVFAECHRVLKHTGLLVFSCHHARHEGWTCVHRAIRHAGFACKQAYPIKAEMSVSTPLKQAKTPIHLDLILVCGKEENGAVHHVANVDITHVLRSAEDQIRALKSANISVSLGDAKVILMGRFLCAAHRLWDIDKEETFLADIERHIDDYVADVIKVQGEVLYTQDPSEQLVLFEEMANYLTHRESSGLGGKSRS